MPTPSIINLKTCHFMEKTSFTLHHDATGAVNRLRLELLEASIAKINWRGRNRFSFNRLFLIGRGQGLVINHNDDSRFVLEPDTALFMPVGADLEFEFNEKLEFFAFHFNAEILPGFDFFSGCQSCLQYRIGNKLLTDLSQLYTKTIEFPDAMQLTSWLWREISYIGRTLTIVNPILKHHEKYHRLAEYLHRNASAGLSVQNIARAVGENYDTLSREIKADLHLTLKEMLFRELQRRAEVLLLTGDITVKETAAELGFASEFYFSKFFKRRTGLPPSRYRNLIPVEVTN